MNTNIFQEKDKMSKNIKKATTKLIFSRTKKFYRIRLLLISFNKSI